MNRSLLRAGVAAGALAASLGLMAAPGGAQVPGRPGDNPVHVWIESFGTTTSLEVTYYGEWLTP